MDSINLIATFYKQELADANEQKVLYKTQCELYKQEIEKILDLEAEDKMERVEVEAIEQKGCVIMYDNLAG